MEKISYDASKKSFKARHNEGVSKCHSQSHYSSLPTALFFCDQTALCKRLASIFKVVQFTIPNPSSPTTRSIFVTLESHHQFPLPMSKELLCFKIESLKKSRSDNASVIIAGFLLSPLVHSSRSLTLSSLKSRIEEE